MLSSLLLLLNSESVRRKTAFYHGWAKKIPKQPFPMLLFLAVWGYLGVAEVVIAYRKILLLPLQCKLCCVCPLHFPFCYWDEEMKRKEGNTKKRAELVSLCLPLRTCTCVLGRGESKMCFQPADSALSDTT